MAYQDVLKKASAKTYLLTGNVATRLLLEPTAFRANLGIDENIFA